MDMYSEDYLLDKKVKIFQPINGYRASSDAVILSSLVDESLVKAGDEFLDVGSGTGAISLCIAKRLQRKTIHITGLDIQEELVELSNKSAHANEYNEFLHYEYFDIRERSKLQGDCYNWVITNPPYSDHDMPSPNPSKKLAHNHQSFDLERWLSFCLKMLQPKGHILLINRAEAINEILSAMYNKAGSIRILPIYSKEGQTAKRIAIIAQKGSHGITEILPPFYTHNADSSYTDKAQKILREGLGYFE